MSKNDYQIKQIMLNVKEIRFLEEIGFLTMCLSQLLKLLLLLLFLRTLNVKEIRFLREIGFLTMCLSQLLSIFSLLAWGFILKRYFGLTIKNLIIK